MDEAVYKTQEEEKEMKILILTGLVAIIIILLFIAVMIFAIGEKLSEIAPEKNDSSNDRRPDNVKQLASDTAAAFAYWLIFKAFS